MTDQEIDTLKKAFTPLYTFWQRDLAEAPRLVSRIGNPPKPGVDDEPDPSDCAYLHDGGYVALDNASFDQFVFIYPVDQISDAVPVELGAGPHTCDSIFRAMCHARQASGLQLS